VQWGYEREMTKLPFKRRRRKVANVHE